MPHEGFEPPSLLMCSTTEILRLFNGLGLSPLGAGHCGSTTAFPLGCVNAVILGADRAGIGNVVSESALVRAQGATSLLNLGALHLGWPGMRDRTNGEPKAGEI
jgi:hypothetical protein